MNCRVYECSDLGKHLGLVGGGGALAHSLPLPAIVGLIAFTSFADTIATFASGASPVVVVIVLASLGRRSSLQEPKTNIQNSLQNGPGYIEGIKPEGRIYRL